MSVLAITAHLDRIAFHVNAPEGAEIHLCERVAIVGEKPGRLLSEERPIVKNSRVQIERFDGAHDRLYSTFHLYIKGEPMDGAKYVTDFGQDVQANREPYPQPDTFKALHATEEDIRTLGIRQETYNISLPSIMTLSPEDALAYEHDGKTYYFIRERIEKIDRHMKKMDAEGVLSTMILLNSPRLFGSGGEKALLDAAIHPSYDWESKTAFISAFDMRTEDGQGYYRAFCEFLAERYTRPDRAYGRVGGAIISNEVDSQYLWGNGGEMPVESYAREYERALRLAWLCGKKHAAYFRVYASFDHHWTGRHDATQPLKYYCGRDLVDAISDCCRMEGDFDWHIAYHPYPEDLNDPDFWNDRTADFTFTTRRITFKNMEVLPAYLGQERFLYRGEPKRIIFSEQGFGSKNGPLQELSEQNGEAGYVLAYMKARNIETVDMFMHHAYVDNPHEFGLNLGIRRYEPGAEMNAGEKKPIYYAVQDMDTPAEAERVKKARAFIGETLFDYLLHPPKVTGDRDTFKDEEFG